MRGYQVTDPRDRIYALLGLASDSTLLKILPDYSMSHTQLFTDVATAMMWHLQNVDHLSYCYRSTSQLELPSWVPNWTIQKRQMPILSNTFDASRNPLSRFEILLDSKLRLSSLIAGEILAMCETSWAVPKPKPESETSHTSKTKSLNSLARTVLTDISCLVRRHSGSYAEEEEIAKLATYTACAGLDLRSDGSWARHVHSYSLYSKIMRQDQLSDPAKLYCASVANRSSQRKAFVTKNGYFGIGPSSTQIGDFAVILLGGRVPYLLRHVNGNGYVLVGECYVYGIMDGELLSSGKEFSDIFII
ncbi:hypothetical protein AOQ84DRAFT_382945 [Glonium stellatum]|uniref:Heterokaryon incompatibility domain-containing protein n=1 Tax=Glonium stellatum TaxID=574774 RepID=A0A8E2EPU7_9PEZI|nr:hypothetical protein AOQ84DRAFT_382945 [Glonium stellatum]